MWVFGLVDTSATPAVGYMEIVPNRQAGTLLPIIQQHVAPGTMMSGAHIVLFQLCQMLHRMAQSIILRPLWIQRQEYTRNTSNHIGTEPR